jgi:hypothetical protein
MCRGFALVFLVALLPIAAVGQSGDYLQRFAAIWSGGGMVRLSLAGSPWRVKCHLTPTFSDNAVSLAGACRLHYLFFLSNDIVAKLKYDQGTDSYSGTYVVDNGPPAILSGTRSDDVLTLNVRWPMPVNGHLDAVIRIVNDGRLFTLTTTDPIGIDGKPVVTSDLSFANSPK